MSALYKIGNELIAPLYVILSPFAAFLIFVVTAAIAIVFSVNGARKIERRIYTTVMSVAVVFCLYTAFNIYDYRRYRQYGLAISPINQLWFYLFASPPDLYKPYAVIPLLPSTCEYGRSYSHRYGGCQEIVLNLANNTLKESDYENPDEINVSFKCVVTCLETGTKVVSSRDFTTYYLSPGTNRLSLCQYDINTTEELAKIYKVNIKIDGCLEEFLGKYPGSYLAIRNGSTK